MFGTRVFLYVYEMKKFHWWFMKNLVSVWIVGFQVKQKIDLNK